MFLIHRLRLGVRLTAISTKFLFEARSLPPLEQLTTNLGVRSSNLFGRATKPMT